MGFSTADAERLYLPVDPDPDAPCVSEAQGNDGLFETVRAVLALRHREPHLAANGPFSVLHAEPRDPLFVYRRGDRVIAVNPSGRSRSAQIEGLSDRAPLFMIGTASADGDRLTLAPQSFVLL